MYMMPIPSIVAVPATLRAIADSFGPHICRYFNWNMDTAERLLKLLGLLEGRIDWTAQELARRLEVTTRTIRRDITRLRDLGYPVEAVAGPGGGYRLGAGGKLPPLLLDDDEALAVALGLRVSATTAVGGLEDSSLSALAKLEHVLPARLRSRLEDISDATTSTLGVSRSEVEHSTLAIVASTIRKRERLRLGYTDGEGRKTERHIEPVQLVHTGRRWYLVAFDLDRDDWRTFRLDRVAEPVATGMKAVPRKGPDPVDLVQRGITVDAWKYPASILLHAHAERAMQEISPTVGTVEPIDETSCRLIIGADEMGWLARYLLSLSMDFDVESPGELRAELSSIGQDLAARYTV
jgi:predicted DNA-binding transcriptional regulator YafY